MTLSLAQIATLDKGLSKSEGDDQLVKHKDTEMYIPIDHEKTICPQ